ncbi:MAG: electron transfer flavoprotein subunit alpha/FixB family protein [bacterium]
MVLGLITSYENFNKIKILSCFVQDLCSKTNQNSTLVLFNLQNHPLDQQQLNQISTAWNQVINIKIVFSSKYYIPEIVNHILNNQLSQIINLNDYTYIVSNYDQVFSEIIPYLSYKYNGSIVSQVESINEDLSFNVSAFGGKIISKIEPIKKPVFITIKSYSNNPKLSYENVPITEVELDLSNHMFDIEVIHSEHRESSIKLEEARIVISGGRGIGGKEGFELIKAVAEELGAAVGASRAAVDSGWIDPQHQVGQTGKTVSPDLYIAVGISGASQHIAGMNKSKIVVSINTDPEAPIFKYSHFGIIEDYKTFLNDFLKVLKQSKLPR